MALSMSRFESIGDNCEFGFVQRAHGHEVGSLLRWALLHEAKALARGLETRFAGIYEFENLVPAGGGQMVFDRELRVAFHSDMTSTERNGAFEFLLDEEARRAIHREERDKIQYLVNKFIATLCAGEKILVFKQNQDCAMDDILRIQHAIAQYGKCTLLHVLQMPDKKTGSVFKASERLYQGVIDRFASYDHADDVSLNAWTEICTNVLELHTNEKSDHIPLSEPPSKPGAT